MNDATELKLKSRGQLLDTSLDAFGFLTPAPSRNAVREELLTTLQEQGYLFIRDMFNCEDVLSVRQDICQIMNEQGLLDTAAELMDCVPHPSVTGNHREKGSATFDGIATKCQSMQELLYNARTQDFFQKLLGGPARHFDLTWFRGIAPGFGTVPHCDVVYMGRGTHELYTMWVPYGEISLNMGGLMVLEGSLNDEVQSRIRNYTVRDVDDYCENRPLPNHVNLDSLTDNKVWNGWLASNPVTLRNNLGGRWLTAEYRPGDSLIFSCKLVHASLDNQSDRFRLSSDCRYQLAAELVDERFVGAGPLGHVGKAKRGRIC